MTDIPTCCTHCAIVRALDIYAEAKSPTNVDDTIAGLMEVMAEMIAMYPERNDRRRRVKEITGKLAGMVSSFREEGRYPGGLGTMEAASEHRH